MAMQLCKEAVLQESPKQITRGRVGGYFWKQYLGNNCEMFGFTIQSQGCNQRLLSETVQFFPGIVSNQILQSLQYTIVQLFVITKIFML